MAEQSPSKPMSNPIKHVIGAAPPPPSRVVHLELHTRDLSASAFYSQLLHWRELQIDTASGCYHALELGGDLGGGIVECGTGRAVWPGSLGRPARRSLER